MTPPARDPAGLKPIRVLVLEDHASDAELMIHELRRAGFDPQWQRVETEADFLAQLEAAPELILSDFSLPRFDGLSAVTLLRKRELDIPFILVTGTLGDEAAVATIKQGATDYLLKDRLVRLGPAVERALSEKRLRDERRRLEEQFRQAQKMEAVGRLAGGVAHDFNNLLAVMVIRADLARLEAGLSDDTREALQEIRSAADRAAELTRQLLLFSRRQVMQPRHLDLNESVTGLAKMLQRILGEDVRLHLDLHPTPLVTYADPGMLDQVLMNLAVNARDAMPTGGRLTLETAEKTLDDVQALLIPDASPGRYVWLRVSDTGCGIAPKDLPQIFEPFFTTKEPGKGTGLGLATVFGIVHQHHGSLRVQTELGKGTAFEVFLPVADPAAARPPAAAERPRPARGTETILVVEDDHIVRALLRKVLEGFGYQVLEAADGVEAMDRWDRHKGQVALLLTDLVMPGGLTGQELAARLQAAQPGLKVAFTTGYSTEIAGRELKLQPGQGFLQKPASPDCIAAAVRKLLDE